MNKHRSEFFTGPDGGSIEELVMLTAFLDARGKSDVFTRLAALFGNDFPAFMAVFQGESLRVPTRTYLERTAFYCRIRLFVQKAGDDQTAIEQASMVFQLPVARIQSVCEKVDTRLQQRGQEA